MKTLRTLALLFLCFNLQAETFVVSKTAQAGGNTYNTINEAVQAAQHGDTIEVGPGVYEESVVLDRNLTLRGAGPQYVTIKPLTEAPAIRSPTGGSVPKIVRIVGFTVASSRHYGIEIQNSQSAYIENCVFSSSKHGLVSTAPNGVHNLARIFVLNCTFALIERQAIYVYDEYSDAGHLSIQNGLFFENGKTADTPVIYFNFGSLQADYLMNFGVQPFGANVPNVRTADPKFISASTGNFVLSAASPARNAGWPGSGFEDPDGSQNDLGAYGGPGAAAFWPYPDKGPVITGQVPVPVAVTQGAKLKIKASATTR